MAVKFKGSSLRPAPFVRYDKAAIYNATRDIVGYTYNFTLTGHILSIGSELNSNGVGSGVDMDGVLDGQKYIRNLFSESGLLEIESTVSSAKEIKAWATPQSIEFSEGTWVNRTDYSVTLSADSVEGDIEASGLAETSESWYFSENADGTESVTHDVSARGIYKIDSNGDPVRDISEVVSWVDSKKIDSPLVSTPLGQKSVYNLLRSQTVDESELSVSLTENFTNNEEDYILTESKSEQVAYDPSFSSSVSYNVRIQGLEEENDNDAYLRAETAYESLKAQWTESAPYRLSSEVITRDYTTGAIDLNRTFTHNKISNIIDNSIEESIDVNIQNRSDLVAQINIPGKPDGPLFQDLNMESAMQKTVNITGRMAPATSGFIPTMLEDNMPNTDPIIASLEVTGGYVVSDTATWNPITGEFNRSVTWTY